MIYLCPQLTETISTKRKMILMHFVIFFLANHKNLGHLCQQIIIKVAHLKYSYDSDLPTFNHPHKQSLPFNLPWKSSVRIDI